MEKTKRGRTSYQDKFDKAFEALRSAQKPFSVKSLTLKSTLDEKQVREYLKQYEDSGAIVIGPGGGGGSIQVPKVKVAPVRIFISYSHVDDKDKIELVKHFRPFVAAGFLTIWNDANIKPGEKISDTISINLDDSDIVVLLLSVDFLNSSYCYDKEMKRAIDLNQDKKIKIMPIVLRACNWMETPLKDLNALPKDGKAIHLFPNLDAEFAKVSAQIAVEAKAIFTSKSLAN